VNDSNTTEEDRIKDLEARIKAAREARDANEARRAARFRASDLERELADEERKAADEATLLELEEEHGRNGVAIMRVQTSRNGMVVVRKPNHLHYGRFIDKGKTDRVSVEKIVKDHLLYPDHARFDAILQDEFDTLRKCSNALSELHGLNLREALPGK
jgi:hypothetical protein